MHADYDSYFENWSTAAVEIPFKTSDVYISSQSIFKFICRLG